MHIMESTSYVCYMNLQSTESTGQHDSSEITCKGFFVCAHAHFSGNRIHRPHPFSEGSGTQDKFRTILFILN